MPEALTHLEHDVAAVRALLGGEPAAGDAALGSLTDHELVTVGRGLGRILRDTESLLAQVTAEVDRRSPAAAGKDGLAKKQGYANPVALIAACTGGSTTRSARLATVGRATAARHTITGDTRPPAHPHVAAALAAGDISVEASAVIIRMLDGVAPTVPAEHVEYVEKILAEKAAELPLDLLTRLVREAEARLDQDGIAPREAQQREQRFLTMRQDSTGMVRLSARLDAETALPVKRAIESIVTHEIRSRRPRFRARGDEPGVCDGREHADADSTGTDCSRHAGPATASDTDADADADADAIVADHRTIPQLQADALAMIAQHVTGCGRVPTSAATTMVVRTSLETLRDGVGHGTVDGLDQPVSAGSLRRLAASADIIPAVLGTDSLPLDLGRSARLFTTAQRIALAERDGGCACCGLDVAYTEAHHIRWWERDSGTSDLDNGVLLCPPCHTRVHNDGWTIEVREHRPWFIPPPHVDPDRRPRAGGRQRFRIDIEHVVA